MSVDVALPLQYAVIALAVLLSAGFVARRQFPGAVRRLRVAVALPLVREGRPEWVRWLGRRIAPTVAGGGNSCGGCNGCD